MTLERIMAILNEHDPMGLLDMDAPLDEYKSEAKEIHRHLNPNQSLQFIWELIYWVFAQSFNTGSVYDKDGNRTGENVFLGDYAAPKERYLNIAMDIWLEFREEAKE